MTTSPHAAMRPFWRTLLAPICLAALIVGLFLDVWHQIAKDNLGAFLTFYPAAAALRRGRDPYAAAHGMLSYIYPPLYAFLLQPLAGMSRIAAARVMLTINSGCILAALVLGARAMQRRFGIASTPACTLWVAVAAGLVAAVPIHNELRGLETNCILLLSFVLALYWLDRRPILSGLALAVAINIKYLPVIALPYLLLRRRYSAAAATVVWTIALALLPATTIGWSANLKYLRFSLGGLVHLAGAESAGAVAHVHATDVATSISITSAMARATAELRSPKLLGLALTAAAASLWAMSIILAYLRRRVPVLAWPHAAAQGGKPFKSLVAIEWTALVVIAMAFSPNTQNRNLVLAVVPAILAVVLASMQSSGQRCVLLLTALIFLAVLLPIAGMGKPFTILWVSGGGACWCLLVVDVALSWIAIGRIAQRPSERP